MNDEIVLTKGHFVIIMFSAALYGYLTGYSAGVRDSVAAWNFGYNSARRTWMDSGPRERDPFEHGSEAPR